MQNEKKNCEDLQKALTEAAGKDKEKLPQLLCHVFNKERNKISKKITLIDEAFLDKLGFNVRATANLLFELKAKRSKISYKNVNDPVHGTIRLHPLAVAIIDTPPFQRLRHIHQLGMTSYVYPGGTHTRFEHSLGVYHLAGKLLEVIRNNQPDLHITELDVLCVQIAALCHDIGHGPFSHMFDKGVIQEMNTSPNGSTMQWRHETQSKHIIDKLILPELGQNETDLTASTQFYEEWGLTVEDKNFILALIDAPDNVNYPTGRDELSFLYDIVRDGLTGLDVDRWDYYMRDCLHLGLKNSFLPVRLMQHLRVLDVSEHAQSNSDRPPREMELQFCVRDKERQELYNMFNTRFELHRKAYKHPVVQAVDMMMSTALRKVFSKTKIGQQSEPDETTDTPDRSPPSELDPALAPEADVQQVTDEPLPDLQGQQDAVEHSLSQQVSRSSEYTLSKILGDDIDSLKAFLSIDDRIVPQIMNTVAQAGTDDDSKRAIEESQELLKCIEKRKLWKLIAILKRKAGQDITGDTGQLADAITTHQPILALLGNGETIKLRNVNMHFGRRHQNPLANIRFYDKNEKLLPSENPGEVIKPSGFEIELVYVYCTDYKIATEGKEYLRLAILALAGNLGFEEGQRP